MVPVATNRGFPVASLSQLIPAYSSPVSISRIQSPTGEILTDPLQINGRFATYNHQLYDSRVSYMEEEMHIYLDSVDLPCLTESARNKINSLLTLKEIQSAVSSSIGENPRPE